jgi:uncharacterized protein (DUF983 family)
MNERSMPSFPVMFTRGITRRCPRCGSGGLFRRWLTMVADCPRCGLHFEREEGFFLGAMVVNIIITEGTLIVFLIVAFARTLPDPPLVRLAVIGALLGLLMPVLSYPFTKTTWCAIDQQMRRSLGDSWTDEQQVGFSGGRGQRRAKGPSIAGMSVDGRRVTSSTGGNDPGVDGSEAGDAGN